MHPSGGMSRRSDRTLRQAQDRLCEAVPRSRLTQSRADRSQANRSRALRRSDVVVLVAGAALLAAWDASGLDLAVTRLFGDAHGFRWRDAWLTRRAARGRARARVGHAAADGAGRRAPAARRAVARRAPAHARRHPRLPAARAGTEAGERDELPVGPARIRRRGGLRAALVARRGRRRAGPLLPVGPRHGRVRVPRRSPAAARAPAARGARLARRRAAGRHAVRRGPARARRPPREPHALVGVAVLAHGRGVRRVARAPPRRRRRVTPARAPGSAAAHRGCVSRRRRSSPTSSR